jgi:hypothetical protein
MSATSPRFAGPDGREYVSVNVATYRVFARACCDELKAREGRSLHHLLRTAKSISVPAELLAGARERLSKPEQEKLD